MCVACQTSWVTRALKPSTERVVHRVWAERLKVEPRVFEASRPVFIDRSDLTAAVVVRLGTTVAVAAPQPALSLMRRLTEPRLLDVASLLGALRPVRPHLLGAASLSFVDSEFLLPRSDDVARPATEPEIDAVISRCTTDERDESGLAHMSARWVVRGDTGIPEAAAGYEVWGGELAHLGVAVAAQSRGRGLGAHAATAAAVRAIGAGLVPQWRCRLDNHASAHVGHRLGFVRLGEQIAIDLASESA